METQIWMYGYVSVLIHKNSFYVYIKLQFYIINTTTLRNHTSIIENSKASKDGGHIDLC